MRRVAAQTGSSVSDRRERPGPAMRFGGGEWDPGRAAVKVSKFKADAAGSRLAIVFNGSPLFTGGAGSGESEIRRWLVENDWLEAVVALPEQPFHDSGISTYVWVVTNRKSPERKGKVQLVNAASLFVKMRKSLGNKRHEIGDGTAGKPDRGQ